MGFGKGGERMDGVLWNAWVWLDGRFGRGSVFLKGGAVERISPPGQMMENGAIDCSGYHVFPGFTDAHVHLREPGFSEKETIGSGTAAAARGGFSAVCAMPNLDPVPDGPESLEVELALIREEARVRVLPFGALTRGQKGKELADLAGMAPFVAGFSDDGFGVQDAGMMREAMEEAARLQKVVAAHCEDSRYPAQDPQSEWRQLARDLELAAKTKVKYHACHLSCAQSVALMREAGRAGADATCETAPHYLLLDAGQVRDEGRFRMNPPIRAREDREALLEGLSDGTVGLVATDHAPHTEKEKAGGFHSAKNGVVGLETAFSLLYLHLVKPGLLPLARLVDAMSGAPNRRFGIPDGLAAGLPASLSVWDLAAEGPVDASLFLSRGRSTPFEGWQARGRCLMTLAQGRVAFREGI